MSSLIFQMDLFLVPEAPRLSLDTSPFTIFCRVRPTHPDRLFVRSTHPTNIILFQVLKYLCLRACLKSF